MDAAEFEHAFGTVLKHTKHVEQVGNDYMIAAPLGVQNFSAREDAGDVAEPPLQHFHVNAECEHVESADFNLLPPMRRRFRIQIDTGETLEANSVGRADEI